MTEEQEDACEDEDDLPALSLSLSQELRVDQSTSILRNVDIELPTEENTRNWEKDPISSFVEPIFLHPKASWKLRQNLEHSMFKYLKSGIDIT